MLFRDGGPHTVVTRGFAPVFLMLSLLGLGSFAVSAAHAQTTDLVRTPVDVTNRVVLSGHHPSWAAPANDLGAVPGDVSLGRFTLVLARTAEREQAFEQLLKDQQTFGAANYHHWLTPVEIGQQFGASAHDVAAIKGWIESQGLHFESVANSGTRVRFTGPASAIASAFGAELHYYKVKGERRMAISTDPQIPKALVGIIKSVSGLYTLQAKPQYHAGRVEVTSGPDGTFCNGGTCTNFIFPADFATIYDIAGFPNQTGGSGQTIAIAGRSRVYKPDVENFESLSGLAKKDQTETIPPAGTDPGAAKSTGGCTTTSNICGDQSEATLDVMRATSVAPGATVDLVVSASSGSEDGIEIAASYVIDTDAAKILNISFGLCEATAGVSGVNTYNDLFQTAAGEGISVFVSAGDSGAAGCDASFSTPPASQSASPNYICSSSYATCVGGTEFADAVDQNLYWNQYASNGYFESANFYIPEGAWNEPDNNGQPQVASTGGGVSAFIATPYWQVGPGVPSARAGRYTPDVAFSASGHDGYFGCLAAAGTTSQPSDCVFQKDGSFGFEYFFGTSAAAPDMAGIAAILNSSQGGAQGNLDPKLYALAAIPNNNVFNDVTVTSSAVIGCTATVPSMCNNSTPTPTSPTTAGLQGFVVDTGYDEATGLGSINVGKLLTGWNGSTTTLTASANPANFGASVTFTATVRGTGTSTPTGTVTFSNGATQFGTGVLASGVATFATSTLPIKAQSITASYPGDANNGASTSAALIETVISTTGAATTTTNVSDLNPAMAPGEVNFTATVTGNNPTGSVTFLDGTTPLGFSTLTGGVAMFPTTALSAGSQFITALYSGDANNKSSTSAILRQKVIASTTTSLVLSTSTAFSGVPVIFTAGVITSSTNTPSGAVTFKDITTGTTLGTATLSSGIAVLTTSAVALGSHMVYATYGGDAYDTGSATGELPLTISPATFAFAASPATQTINSGAAARYTLTVTPSGTYTSQIAFSCAFSPASSATCAANPVTPNGLVANTTLTITGAQAAAGAMPASNAGLHPVSPLYGFWMPLGVAGLVMMAGKRRRKFTSSVLSAWFAGALLVSAVTMFGCGGGSTTPTPTPPTPQTYTVTVTAKAPASASGGSQAVTLKQTVTLTVE